jgi:hypothetical protein
LPRVRGKMQLQIVSICGRWAGQVTLQLF